MRKKFYFIVLINLLFISLLSAQQLHFSYDPSGNQVRREWICVNCTSSTILMSNQNSHKILDNQEEIISQNNISMQSQNLIASPNPVESNLNVSWQNSEVSYIRNILVNSVNGKAVFEQKVTVDINQIVIPFENLPPGFYLLIADYSNNNRRTLKIVKK